MKCLGRALKFVRERKQIKLTDVATLAGVDRGYLSKIENELVIPSLKKLDLICRKGLKINPWMIIAFTQFWQRTLGPILNVSYEGHFDEPRIKPVGWEHIL